MKFLFVVSVILELYTIKNGNDVYKTISDKQKDKEKKSEQFITGVLMLCYMVMCIVLALFAADFRVKFGAITIVGIAAVSSLVRKYAGGKFLEVYVRVDSTICVIILFYIASIYFGVSK